MEPHHPLRSSTPPRSTQVEPGSLGAVGAREPARDREQIGSQSRGGGALAGRRERERRVLAQTLREPVLCARAEARPVSGIDTPIGIPPWPPLEVTRSTGVGGNDALLPSPPADQV